MLSCMYVVMYVHDVVDVSFSVRVHVVAHVDTVRLVCCVVVLVELASLALLSAGEVRWSRTHSIFSL